jgi:hypothetical protein
MRADLNRAECQNEALFREIQALRQGGVSHFSPEQGSQSYTLKQITLGRGTGGYDNDDCPGDEALQVVLEPRDCDGHTIKAPGELHVEALQITPEGLKTPLSAWDVPPAELRRLWRSGFISTGYFVVLPWKTWPTSEKVRVIARFTLADGRTFEADKDVTVRLAAPARRPQTPLPEPAKEAPPLLPVPHPVEPTGPEITQSWWHPEANVPAPLPPPLVWRPKPPAPLIEAVELMRPQPLGGPLGDGPGR